MRRPEQPWFESQDWPLAGPDWPGTFPQELRSESGMRFVIDLDRGGERCKAPRRMQTLDGRALVFCMMPKGHDTPHLPMSAELEEKAGPMIVREIGT